MQFDSTEFHFHAFFASARLLNLQKKEAVLNTEPSPRLSPALQEHKAKGQKNKDEGFESREGVCFGSLYTCVISIGHEVSYLEVLFCF